MPGLRCIRPSAHPPTDVLSFPASRHRRSRRHDGRHPRRLRRRAAPDADRTRPAGGRPRLRRTHRRQGQRAPDPHDAGPCRWRRRAVRCRVVGLPAALPRAQRSVRGCLPRRGRGLAAPARRGVAAGLPDEQAGGVRPAAAGEQGAGRLLRGGVRRRQLRAQEARSAAAPGDLQGAGHPAGADADDRRLQQRRRGGAGGGLPGRPGDLWLQPRRADPGGAGAGPCGPPGSDAVAEVRRVQRPAHHCGSASDSAGTADSSSVPSRIAPTAGTTARATSRIGRPNMAEAK